MTRWEYKVAEIKPIGVEKSLNELGKDGWELISLEVLPGVYRVFVKRLMASDHPMVGI